MQSLRKCILLVVILLFGSKVFAQPEPQKLSYKVPERVLKAEIKSFDETAPFSLSDYKGKVILVAIWAYWCIPCIEGIDDIVKIREEFAGKNLAIVGISLHYSFSDDRQGAYEFVRGSKFKFKMGLMNEEIGSLLMADDAEVPNFMLLNADGVLVERILGFNPKKTPALLRGEIKELLKSGASSGKSAARYDNFRWRESKAVNRRRKRNGNERIDEREPV